MTSRSALGLHPLTACLAAMQVLLLASTLLLYPRFGLTVVWTPVLPLLAAIGGLLVPAFAMPASFQPIIKLSPLHWGLEAYYGLFLEGGKLKDILVNILPLLGITVFIQLIALYGLKRKNLV